MGKMQGAEGENEGAYQTYVTEFGSRMQRSIFPVITRREVYSHSIVAGGLEEMSYTTRLTPFTLFIMSFDTFARNS